MIASRRGIIAASGLLTTAAVFHSLPAMAQQDVSSPKSGGSNEQELVTTAADAYVYGYSLISVEMSRRVITNVEKPTAMRAPMGQFVNLREYPTAAFRDVTAPNADTLYSNAFVNLSKEPWVLSWPDMGDRYYVWNVYDAWVPVVFDPGSRTTGQKAQSWAITGPGWKGSLPQGVQEIKCPSATAWVLGRTYSTGTSEDYKAVAALQDQYKLVPLSFYGKAYTPPPGKVDPSIDMKRSVRDSVNALDGKAFFSLMAELMKDNPPASYDLAMLLNLEKLGVSPGKSFDSQKADPEILKAMERGRSLGLERILAFTKVSGANVNGWLVNPGNYPFGTNYLARAWLCAFGIPANRPEDATYPYSEVDKDTGHSTVPTNTLFILPARMSCRPRMAFGL